MDARGKKKRGRFATAATLALTLTLAAAAPRPAHAELTTTDVEKFIGYVKQGYGYYSLALSIANYLLGNNGPTLAQQLNDVKVAIIGELRTQRNLAWQEEARDAFDDFAILAARQRTDSQNEALRWAGWQLSQGALNYYAGLVDAVQGGLDDINSLYQLAPTFNGLLVAHVGFTRTRAEITPTDHVPWAEFDIYLKRGMQVNYALIGAQQVMCWPGFNPGRNSYDSPFILGRISDRNLLLKSQLWQKKYWGKVYYRPPVTGSACPSFSALYGGPCEIACDYNHAYEWPRDCGIHLGGTCGPNSNACADEAMAWTIEMIHKTKFSPNGVVRIIRAGMKGILAIGGGDDRFDGPNTTLPEQGMMTDPWVDETLCTNMPGNGGLPNPWGYPVKP
jgi:hypothetical protein